MGVGVGVTATASANLRFHVEIGPTLAAASMVQAAIFHISLLPPALQLPPPHLMRHARRVEIGLRQTANSVGYHFSHDASVEKLSKTTTLSSGTYHVTQM